MNRKTVILAALIIASVCAAVFAFLPKHATSTYRNFPARADGAWVAFGDSLTESVGASEGKDYPTLLGKRLGLEILNRGVAGNTSADGLARVDDVLKLKPAVVLLCLGGNDGLQRRPISETVANLSAIVDRLQADGAFVVLIGVRSATFFDQYHKPFSKLATEKQTFYIRNILQDVLDHPDLMSDNIHPNDAGYELIAERLEKVLRPLLAEQAPSNRK